MLEIQIDNYREGMRLSNFNHNLNKYLSETLRDGADEKARAAENVRDMILKVANNKNSTFDRRYIYRSVQTKDGVR